MASRGWHYGIVKTGKRYAIHEVYPGWNSGKTVWTADPIAADSETRAGVIRILELMLADAKRYKTVVDKEPPDAV